MKNRAVVLSFLLIGVIVAQDRAPSASGEQEIRAMHQHFVTSWGRADAKELAQFFDENGDLIIPPGNAFNGRAAIQAFYQSVFDRGYRGSHAGFEIRKIRLLGQTAIVDGSWSIFGVRNAAGTAIRDEHGMYTAVLEKKGNQWYLVALREMVPVSA